MKKSLCCIALFLALGAVAAEETGYRPNNDTPDGVELGMVYIGATSCGYCREPELKEAVRRAKDLVAGVPVGLE